MKEKTLTTSERHSRSVKKRIFIIDNQPIVRQGLSQLINRESDLMICGEAGNMKQALSTIDGCGPDMVIVDIFLGPGSGLKHIEDFCHQYPQLPVLILSMHDEALYAERCLRAGARGYIMKQEPPEKLIEAIRKVLNGDIYISSSIGPSLINKLLSSNTGVSTSTIERLSNRELEVFRYIGRGIRTRDIADSLNLSIKTIETYISHIKKKMGFKNSRELFLYAVQWSITENEF
jgi:DNA-binding NarL/FixJ family response regulator